MVGSFRLVKEGSSDFYELPVIRTGDRLTHYLALKQKDGSHQEHSLQYTRRAMPVSNAERAFKTLIEEPVQTPIMVLGSYHMNDPGQDMFNLAADDVTAPKRQAEIQAVVDRLALWKPTKVAVESKLGDSLTQARYQAYRSGGYVAKIQSTDRKICNGFAVFQS